MRMAQQSAPVAMRSAAAASLDITGGESRLLLNNDPPEWLLTELRRRCHVSRSSALVIAALAGLFSREGDR